MQDIDKGLLGSTKPGSAAFVLYISTISYHSSPPNVLSALHLLVIGDASQVHSHLQSVRKKHAQDFLFVWGMDGVIALGDHNNSSLRSSLPHKLCRLPSILPVV